MRQQKERQLLRTTLALRAALATLRSRMRRAQSLVDRANSAPMCMSNNRVVSRGAKRLDCDCFFRPRKCGVRAGFVHLRGLLLMTGLVQALRSMIGVRGIRHLTCQKTSKRVCHGLIRRIQGPHMYLASRVARRLHGAANELAPRECIRIAGTFLPCRWHSLRAAT